MYILICSSKHRLSTKESQQSDVYIEMFKKEMELLNNKNTSDREIIFNSSEQLSRYERILADLCERVEELIKKPPGKVLKQLKLVTYVNIKYHKWNTFNLWLQWDGSGWKHPG